jgi:hypothetical protein
MVNFLITIFINLSLTWIFSSIWYENGRMNVLEKVFKVVREMQRDWQDDLKNAEELEKTEYDKLVGMNIRMAKMAYTAMLLRVVNEENDKLVFTKIFSKYEKLTEKFKEWKNKKGKNNLGKIKEMPLK